jgi:hypothetical protein
MTTAIQPEPFVPAETQLSCRKAVAARFRSVGCRLSMGREEEWR